MTNKQYLGVFDHKESDTFRPTLGKRIHANYPVSKTLTCREDSCAIMEMSGGGLSDMTNEESIEKQIMNKINNGCELEVEIKEIIKQSSQLRIRKLTPLECMKLMGFEEEDYIAMREAGLSDSAIYHCAGDSIVVSVLIGIFKQMIPCETTIEEYVERVKGHE